MLESEQVFFLDLSQNFQHILHLACISLSLYSHIQVPEVCQPTASTAQQFFLSALGTSPGGNPSSICGIPQNYQWCAIECWI